MVYVMRERASFLELWGPPIGMCTLHWSITSFFSFFLGLPFCSTCSTFFFPGIEFKRLLLLFFPTFSFGSMKCALWREVSWLFRKSVKNQQAKVGKMWVWTLVLPVTCCLSLGKLLFLNFNLIHLKVIPCLKIQCIKINDISKKQEIWSSVIDSRSLNVFSPKKI